MFKETRAAVATAVSGVAHLPERMNPPIAVVTAGDPYVVQETYGDWSMNLDITLVAAKATSKVATDELDDYLETTLGALPDGTSVTNVKPPFLMDWNGATYLAVKISTNSLIDEGGN